MVAAAVCKQEEGDSVGSEAVEGFGGFGEGFSAAYEDAVDTEDWSEGRASHHTDGKILKGEGKVWDARRWYSRLLKETPAHRWSCGCMGEATTGSTCWPKGDPRRHYGGL